MRQLTCPKQDLESVNEALAVFADEPRELYLLRYPCLMRSEQDLRTSLSLLSSRSAACKLVSCLWWVDVSETYQWWSNDFRAA